MKNPNNNKLPNMFIDSEESARLWMGKIQIRGLDQFLPEPSDYIGKGLTKSEAFFLKDSYVRYKKTMEGKEL